MSLEETRTAVRVQQAGTTPSHAATVAQVARDLATDPDRGLAPSEARERLARMGPNELERRRRPRYAAILLRQFVDPLVALLVAAAVMSAAVGEGVDAVAIAVIVVLNAALGFAQETGAERDILALRTTLRRWANVIRDGREHELPGAEVVPGDLVVLREGDRVPADGRITMAAGLAVDESMLTGESLPVDKATRAVEAATPLAERISLVFAGTGVTRGRGRFLVTATGPRAEVGRIAALAERAEPPPTPLQRRLAGLTRTMVVAGMVITAGLAGVRLAQGASLESAVLLGIAVAVAAVPEGLAATVTIALAIGGRRMAARGAIVRRLPAVEALGSTTVVASDKTGTLTRNELTLRAIAPAAPYGERDVLEAVVLCSTAELVSAEGERRVVGDPIDGALVLAAAEHGLSPTELRASRRPILELPFDADRRRMTVAYEDEDRVHAFVKGAPEVVLARARARSAEPARLAQRAEEWAREGLRVLAVAERWLTRAESEDPDRLERELDPVGLVAFHDPLRPGAGDAIRAARGAGLQVRILTGDHPEVASSVARALELPPAAVAARVTPAQKLRLVEDLQAEGEVVAVTGDGINDAPALRRADVGVAMGRSGTEAAREAADVVLTDDDFTTIVAAIREGRAIADNVRKFVAFLLSANLGEVLAFAIAVLAGLGAPLTIVQVLTVNVLTDGLPAVALARDPAAPDVMERPPERGTRLFPRASWTALGLVGTVVGASAIAAFLAGRAIDRDVAQTMVFVTLSLGELILVFAVRSPLRAAWDERRNGLLLAAVVAATMLLGLAVYLPALHDPIGTQALDAPELAIAVGLATAPFAFVEIAKAVLRRRPASWAARAFRASP